MPIKKFTQHTKEFSLVFPVLFIGFLAVFHFTSNYFQLISQKQFADSLLGKAEEVSDDIVSSIYDVSEIAVKECNEETINKIRQILIKHKYVQDLGLMRNDRVLCSANWGVLNNSPSLKGALNKVLYGFHLASGVSNIFPAEVKYDITKFDNIVAFTIQKPFSHYDKLDKWFSFSLKLDSKGLVFHDFHSKHQFSSPVIIKPQTVKSCSPKYHYCVIINNNRPGLLYYDSFIAILIILVIGIICFLAFYSLISYQEKLNSIEFRLKNAIKNNKLFLEYQPILNVSTKKIIGVESLIRWKDKLHGNVSPEFFLSIAERLSLYPNLAYNAVIKAFQELSPILSKNSDFSLALNVNSYEIRNVEYLTFLKESCEKYNVLPEQIKLEITERIELPLVELSTFAERAKKLGFKVALDDFGTGVSNLVWLTEINFDIIKIDRVFTNSLTDKVKKEMASVIMGLVWSLDRTIIFEGVETQEQSSLIESCREDYQVQGWYYYKSLSLKDLKKVLAKN